MRDAADLQLLEAIVHVLDPRRDQGVVLSHGTIPLQRSPRIGEYLLGHIQQSLRDPTSRAARFVGTAAEDPYSVCGGILLGDLGFVRGSRWLAERLCDLIAGDGRISAGDLVVCRFRAGNHPDVEAFLGLLKLDPTEVFRHKRDRDDEGNEFVTLELEADALPTAGERLQKCAFVRPLDPRPEDYDMVLLDRQLGPGDDKQVAQFFVDRFLGAQLAYGPTEQTRAFYGCVMRVLNQARAEGTLTLADEETLRVAADQALRTPMIDTVAWVDHLPGPADLRLRVGEALVAELPDQQVEVDPREASKIVRKVRFRGSYGLRVDVDAEHFRDAIRSVEPIGAGETATGYRIVIETETWEEVTRR